MKKKVILTILVTFVLLPGFIHGAIPASERAALIALYNSTNGDAWSDHNGWKTPPLHTDGFAMPGTEGNWYGVTLLRDHVIHLSLKQNRLQGSIPPELGNLYRLIYLDLGSNQLSGSIPPGLGYLDCLEGLTLNWNQLSGSIPSELAWLDDLWYLDLNNNKLSGEIPYLNPLPQFVLVDIGYNCLYSTNPEVRDWLNNHDPDWETTQDQCEGKTAKINLNRLRLNFGAVGSGSISSAQTVLVSNTGAGILNWSASSSTSWLSVTPSSGTGDSALSVSVDPSGLAAGNYTGTITISAPTAVNSPQAINVSLHVYDQGQGSTPFGEFSTPVDGASVCNCIPVTGWVLDDVEVQSVYIYNSNTIIGIADFAAGARPDVEAAYPDYPFNYKAGWGYMLLTHALPNGGNGTYTLIAKATDIDGNEVTLGSKTITVDNAHAVKPFGAIDWPPAGGTVSGKKCKNTGWALTPRPNLIPLDGSTIDVVIDGVVKGHPVYNISRSDIQWFFPGYANTDGAGGYYHIDTTKLKNGVHTIAWLVADNAGNSDGIGSRYFTVENLGNSGVRDQGPGIREKRRGAPACAPIVDTCAPTFETYTPVYDSYLPTSDETQIVEIKELERVEIHFPAPPVNNLSPLPIGSTLDRENGIFYWQPGPGFLGEYRFVFVGKDDQGQSSWKNIVVSIKPKE